MANNRTEPSFEDAKTRINEIVSTMSESELKKFQIGLEEWRKSRLSKREHDRKDLSMHAFGLAITISEITSKI